MLSQALTNPPARSFHSLSRTFQPTAMPFFVLRSLSQPPSIPMPPLNFIRHTLLQMTYKVDSHWIKCYKMSLWRRSLSIPIFCAFSHPRCRRCALHILHNSMRSFLYFMRLFLVHASVFIHSADPIHTHTHTMVWHGMAWQKGDEYRHLNGIRYVYVAPVCVYTILLNSIYTQIHLQNSVSASNTWKWIVCIFTAYRYFEW